MREYRAVLFDLDGTLMDTAEGILEATRYTLAHYHREIPPREVLFRFIGPPVQEGFARYLSLGEKEAAAYADTFREYYRINSLLKSAPYEGVGETLDALRAMGLRLAVATYKREDYAKELLAHFDLARRFAVIRGADAAGRLDKTQIIGNCLDALDVDPRAALMVGDSVQDARGAAEAEVDFLGVLYGYGFRSAREVAERGGIGAAKSPAEILKIVQGVRVG